MESLLAKRLGQQLYYDGFFMGAFDEAEREKDPKMENSTPHLSTKHPN